MTEPVEVPQGERSDLQTTARELGLWQGERMSEIKQLKEGQETLVAAIADLHDGLHDITLKVSTLSGMEIMMTRLEMKVDQAADARIKLKVERGERIRFMLIGSIVSLALAVVGFLIEQGLTTTHPPIPH